MKKISRSDCEHVLHARPGKQRYPKNLAKKFTEISLFFHIRFDHLKLQFYVIVTC